MRVGHLRLSPGAPRPFARSRRAPPAGRILVVCFQGRRSRGRCSRPFFRDPLRCEIGPRAGVSPAVRAADPRAPSPDRFPIDPARRLRASAPSHARPPPRPSVTPRYSTTRRCRQGRAPHNNAPRDFLPDDISLTPSPRLCRLTTPFVSLPLLPVSTIPQVLKAIHTAEIHREHGGRNVLKLLSVNTRRTKVVALSTGTHRVPDELRRHQLADEEGNEYSTNLDRNRYGNDDQYLFTVIKFNLEALGLCRSSARLRSSTPRQRRRIAWW